MDQSRMGRGPGDQPIRAPSALRPDQERVIADLRHRLASMEEKLQLVLGERGNGTRKAITAADVAEMARTPVVDPQSAVSGSAGVTYTATEQAMINDLVTAVAELQVAVAQAFEVLRIAGYIKRGV